MAGKSESREFAADLERIQRLRADLRTAGEEHTTLARVLKEQAARAGVNAKAAEESAVAAAQHRDEAARQLAAATALASEIQNARDAGAGTLAEIKKIETDARTLKDSVSAYQETFNKFQEQLDARNSTFQEGKAELDRLTKDIAAAEAELKRIVEKSRTVLGEATVAGLSDRFANEAQEVGERLKRAQWGLVASVIYLFMSAISVLVLPLHPAGSLGEVAGTNGWGTIAVFLLSSVLGKAILLLPAIFLVVFTAKRASDLFHLRAEYTYKYTVAASLPGFKEEAPDHAQAITASAFKELLYNPAAEEGTPKRRGNTWIERLIEPKIKEALERMMKNT